MKHEVRKAAIAAYKERKVVAGVYLVRCAVSGEAWVLHWLDVSTIQTRMWFALRQGGSPHKDMAEAWRKHGEAQFSFEVLETLEDEPLSYVRVSKLKERAAHWRERLGARPC
jgi:hypothetical protein